LFSRPRTYRAIAQVTTFTLAITVLLASSSHAVLVHEYRFDGNANDSIGGANGTLENGAGVANGRLDLDGVDDFVSLPGAAIALNTFSAVTLEQWSTQPVLDRSFTFGIGFGRTDEGGGGQDYLAITTTRGSQASRGLIQNEGLGEPGADGPELNDGLLHHYALTVDDTTNMLSYYIDGQIQGAPVDLSVSGVTLANVSTEFATIGDSPFVNDATFLGTVDEVSIWNNALTATEIATEFANGPVGGSAVGPRLTVDRATGEVVLTSGIAAQDMVRYSLTSAGGALNPANLLSIDSRDADGTGTVDSNDLWQSITAIGVPGAPTDNLIAEEDPVGGGGPDDGASLGTISLGTGLWRASPYEDLAVTITVLDSSFSEVDMALPVIYSGDAIARSDFNGDGDVNGADFTILLDNNQTTLAATTAVQSFALGDTNGDLKNDFTDFRNFQIDFDEANGAGAFLATFGGTNVPEPASVAIAILALAGVAVVRAKN